MNKDLEKLLVVFEKQAQIILEKPGYDPYVKGIAMDCASKMIQHLTQVSHKGVSPDLWDLAGTIEKWVYDRTRWFDNNSSGADE